MKKIYEHGGLISENGEVPRLMPVSALGLDRQRVRNNYPNHEAVYKAQNQRNDNIAFFNHGENITAKKLEAIKKTT